MADQFDPTSIAADLHTATLPRTIHCYDAVESTMDVARQLLPTLGDERLPLLVTADVQTAGRGRLGRRWEAPPGTALLLSLALRPAWLSPERGVALVWMAAVALCEAVEAVAPVTAALKWPNDLLLPLRDAGQGATYAKAAGILLEVGTGSRGLEWAIIGCGVNVSAAPPAAATRYPATSLAAASGGPIARLALLRALLRRLDYWHGALMAGDGSQDEAKPLRELFTAWRGRLLTLGQAVRVETPGGPVEGLAEEVDGDGALLVRSATGAIQVVTAGDVGLLP
jgi:BirA family biotin operon repressor/biotin-[acetyl-CoA-carboxylase] ligase